MSVTTTKRGFTVHLDGLVMKQMDDRRAITCRSRSGEVSYLLNKVVELNPSDEALAVGGQAENELPERTSLYLESMMLDAIGHRAREMHLSAGRLVNVMLKFILEHQAAESQKLINEMLRRDQGQH